MTEPVVETLNVSTSPAEAVTAIRQALPEDAIVRDEDDGIGRFASERVVMLVGRGGKKLGLWRGGWRLVREREETPHLEVELADAEGGATARLVERPEEPPGLGGRAMGAVSNMVTVAAVVVAYHLFRGLEVDVSMVAIIGVCGGLLWSVVAHFWPQQRDRGLRTLVREALAPLGAPEPSSTPRETDSSKADEDQSPDDVVPR